MVERKDAASKEREKSHQEGGSKTADAADQIAGIATLETLLSGWTGFTGLVLKFADVLPDSMVSGFQKMNDDGTKFMASLVKAKTGIQTQQAQQGPRGAEIAQTGARIQQTGAQAGATQGQFAQAQTGAAKLAEANQQQTAFIAGARGRRRRTRGTPTRVRRSCRTRSKPSPSRSRRGPVSTRRPGRRRSRTPSRKWRRAARRSRRSRPTDPSSA